MTQHKLFAVTPDRDTARVLAGGLQDLVEPAPDALTLFEAGSDGWRVEAYYAEQPDADALHRALEELTGRSLPLLAPEQIPDLNWVALSQAALPPVAAGRFTVHGSHDRERVPRGPNAILIDAGEAFGTAHHATTYGCLGAIGRLVRRRRFRNVLDLGSGSGVLSIAVARALPGSRILATDIDRQSVRVAETNVALNATRAQVRLAHADGVRHPAVRGRAPFDLVIANILAGPLVALSGDIARVVEAGGTLVLSGLLVPQAPQVVAAYVSKGFRLEAHDRITGWSTLVLRRRGGRR